MTTAAAPPSTTEEKASACAPDQLETQTPGTLTVGTDKPAFPPYFVDDDPTNGKGFESAVAYAVADELGFAKGEVKWAVVPFNSSYAPGPKDFDFDINQISITPQREQVVDFSRPYYVAPQAVVVGQGLGSDEREIARRSGRRDDRSADRDHQPRRGRGRDQSSGAAQGLQRLQRRGHGPQAESGRRRGASTSRPPSTSPPLRFRARRSSASSARRAATRSDCWPRRARSSRHASTRRWRSSSRAASSSRSPTGGWAPPQGRRSCAEP